MHAFSKAEYTHELTLSFPSSCIYPSRIHLPLFEAAFRIFRAVNDVL
jgi:hypothetical protein